MFLTLVDARALRSMELVCEDVSLFSFQFRVWLQDQGSEMRHMLKASASPSARRGAAGPRAAGPGGPGRPWPTRIIKDDITLPRLNLAFKIQGIPLCLQSYKFRLLNAKIQ
jgi:hypothetical protein